jgi:formiminotetrahydrofolate cyclodeaminase
MLVNMTVKDFVEEVGSESPAPGGGSVAALCGALGGALAAMVANLTIGKKGYEGAADEMEAVKAKGSGLQNSLLAMVDKDTEAFNKVMAAFKLPKASEDDKATRREAIQSAMKGAAQSPFEIMKASREVLDLAQAVAAKGNQNSITDACVAALLADAAVKGAALNVKINLSSIKDEAFVNRMASDVARIEDESDALAKQIMEEVSSKL